jgi:dihydrofolate synthase / folylpolyglutamate synthase
MQYEEAVQYLLGLGHETLTIKLGLLNTELLLKSLDYPHKAFSSVQIAGTNGKGSTAAVLDSICRAAGIKTALYTSPHLTSITERIRIAGKEISREDFARHTSTVRRASQQLVENGDIAAPPTFFEQVTAIALLAFRDAGVELVILETGLGGRLDSTTAAEASLIGITPIGMDHEEYLGNTIESIAAEKAATIRPGVQVVIGKQSSEALAVLSSRCIEVGVKAVLEKSEIFVEDISPEGRHCITIKTPSTTYEKVSLGLLGRHQIDNAALAIRLAEELRSEFEIPASAIAVGVESAQHPGRLELISSQPMILLDGAHNPDGAQSLRDYLEEFGPRPLTLVFGAMRDKRLDQLASILFPIVDELVLTTIQNPRSASIELLQPLAAKFARKSVTASGSSTEALRVAVDRTPTDGMVCITGSLYLVGELRSESLRIAGMESG